jgi:hypothetical protein
MREKMLFAAFFSVSEIIAAVFFYMLARIFYEKTEFDIKSVTKGVLERIFLLITLSLNQPAGLTFFGALKLATRIKHEEKNSDEIAKFNDYYLIGNLISVLIALGYTWVYQNIARLLPW